MFSSRPLVLAGLGGAGLLLLAACGSGSSSSAGSSSGAGHGSSTTGSASARGYGGGYGGTSTRSAGAAPKAGSAVGVRVTKLGTVLVDPRKMTLYAFAADSPGHSACSGSCLNYWPPVPAADTPSSPPTGVTAKFGSVAATNGSRQLTVNGYPVYTYVGDSAPGQANGQGTNLSGGLWWAVSPNGSWNKRAG